MDAINSNISNDFFTTPNSISVMSNVTGLQPSTSYIIEIEPCLTTPSTCYSQYATSTNATTGGLSGFVTKPSLKMTFDGSCNVSWSTVMNVAYISGFKLVISSTKAIVSSYYKDDFKTNEIFLPSEKTSYVLPKVFNRKYNVSIQAKTCAGFGPGTKAVGECVTDTNAPSNIQAPTANDEITNDGNLKFSINVPDEANGPISCYFIVVQVNGGSKQLTDFNNAKMIKMNNSEIKDEYIAIALNRTSVGQNHPEISLFLGDQVKTRCDISGKNNSDKEYNSKYTYAAYNNRLSLKETYRIFLVTSTPTKEGVSFRASDALVIGKPFTVEEEEISSTNVPLRNFEDHYRNLFHNDKALFHEQFKRIKIESKANVKSTTFASTLELKRKNRYKNILPYDETRVSIKANDTGYINACYVNGYAKSRKYIATQGPLPTTVDDFWLMIVEQECKVIVMLAKCFEAGKKKCQKYWPDYGITSSFGVVKVFNSEEVKYSGFIRRRFQVETNDGNIAMEVLQYQYVNWPDHDIPFTTSNLVRMHKVVMQCQGEFGDDAPMIVHCSAGAGRTGTFIGYDYLLEEGRDTGNVDVLQCVLKMRSQRVDMIQNCDQYILLHKLILENYLFKNTDYNAQDIGHKFQEITSHEKRREFRDEFEKLSILEPLKCSKLIGRRYENRRYNISDDVIPYDHNAVVLIMCNNEASVPYVNSSWIETYDESTSMIAAQAPMNEGIPFFWRSVLDNRVNTIIMLACVEECIQYWPHDVRATLSMENVSVTLMEENINGSISRRIFKVFRGSQQTHVTQIQYSGWSNEQCPEDGSIVLDIIGEMQRNARSVQESACLIHCTDGAGRTGVFCALANLIERLKHENKVDIFRAVKDLRDCRQGMVQTLVNSST
uniref:receptor-type tyrosine-protein phosphatase C-like n=1 Tax=Styela clava TaxID=7725 RepID=UPI001939BCA3|nr:receptor-type tyrosine-protein phosphatase C-like [Styela clava]